MYRKVLFGGAVLLLIATVSINARPEGVPATVEPLTSTTEVVAGSSTTVAPESSKITRFFDDVSSAIMQGTAKVKESFESAASSVKDGVLRGYDYVKDKFQGSNGDVTEPENNGTVSTSAITTTTATSGSARALSSSTDALVTTVTSKTTSPRTVGSLDSAAKKTSVYKIEPNDEEPADDDRIVFKDAEETGTDSPVTTTTPKKNLDDRFIIDGPLACKTGETLINGKCRNTF
ncbi:uncharacterized protein LOC129768088 [Toxorhynchites rutilus septentrionalis]|uniref:uncharacterized protein LOC129768088 n=1 Tax=Toxorhynchites rutilus septentrionalis TaxID=329112 RepID=UPI00247A2EAE|nr:uncharacterized protein LOC129768088 [Toxorhynchites rutilus septentrionalis]